MRRKKSLMFGGAAIAGLSLLMAAGVANADRGHGWRHGATNLTERYDANNDGKVSQEEIDANRTQWHADFDRDKSGDLSLAEFEQLWLRARHEQMVREYQEFDRDGDGKVTAEEYKRPMSNTVANMDRNGDGFISRDDRFRRRGGDQPEQPQQQ
jgi:Ca2+-binding EF-hand superfamily protein